MEAVAADRCDHGTVAKTLGIAAGTGVVVFNDTFDGRVGATADPAKWVLRQERFAEPFQGLAQIKDENVFQDGAGHLVLQVKREPAGWMTHRYSGAMLGTFEYGWGWPPPVVKASWEVPYRIEMRARFPVLPGGWGGAWNLNVDRPPSQHIYELDWAEERLGHPDQFHAGQRTWRNGSHSRRRFGCYSRTSGPLAQWHVYTADVSATKVDYRIDGRLCGTGFGVTGRHGAVLNLGIGKPGTWGAAGGRPNPSDPGPWRLEVDYFTVTSAS